MQNLVFIIAFLCCAPYTTLASEVSPEQARNWHQWRGPYANGVATTANPPIEWSERKNIRWKVEVPGRGSSSPIVWNDHIYLLTAVKTDRMAQNAPAVAVPQPPQDQERRPRGRRGRPRSPPPTNYYQFVVVCYDRRTGQKVWQRVAAEEVPHEALQITNTHA